MAESSWKKDNGPRNSPPRKEPTAHSCNLKYLSLIPILFQLHKIHTLHRVSSRYKKVKWSHYRPGVAQRVGRGIALLFHGRGTRRGWVVSNTPRPHFTPGKESVPILQEVGWAPGPVWKGGKSLPHRDSIPYRPARNQSLHRMSYPAHFF